MFLRAEGVNGAEHLPLLLQRCQALDVTRVLDCFEEALLGFGAMTMADIVGAVGFDPRNDLHISILGWIVRSTSSSNINVAAHSIYGLGNLGVAHPNVIECLSLLVMSPKRTDEYRCVSLRAIALRILRRLDSEMAAMFVDAPAFDEYAQAVAHWLDSTDAKSSVTDLELHNELEWLREIGNRRTMR